MEGTPYRISTITVVGSVDTAINLDALYKHLRLDGRTFSSIQYTDSDGFKRFRGVRTSDTSANTTVEHEPRESLPDVANSAEPTKRSTSSLPRKQPHGVDGVDGVDGNENTQRTEKSTTTPRHFDNQATVIAYVPLSLNDGRFERSGPTEPLNKVDELDEHTLRTKTKLNVKIFRNGHLQITGVKCIEQGSLCIDLLIAELKELARILDGGGECAAINKAECYERVEAPTSIEPKLSESTENPSLSAKRKTAKVPQPIGLLEDVKRLKNTDFRVCLINSDYNSGIRLKREKLYDVLLREYGDIMCSYEPCIYPGVKIQYCWNVLNRAHQDGICRCACRGNLPTRAGKHGKGCKGEHNNPPLPARCTGKGYGNGEGDCRRLTIAVFRSGCIIITGANSYTQLDDAYAFVRGVLLRHYAAIENLAPPPPPPPLSPPLAIVNSVASSFESRTQEGVADSPARLVARESDRGARPTKPPRKSRARSSEKDSSGGAGKSSSISGGDRKKKGGCHVYMTRVVSENNNG